MRLNEENSFAHGAHRCSSLEIALRLISWALVQNQVIPGGDSVARDDIAA